MKSIYDATLFNGGAPGHSLAPVDSVLVRRGVQGAGACRGRGKIGVLCAHTGIMGALSTLGSCVSLLLLHPHDEVSHLGGAAVQTGSSGEGANTGDDSGRTGATWPS